MCRGITYVCTERIDSRLFMYNKLFLKKILLKLVVHIFTLHLSPLRPNWSITRGTQWVFKDSEEFRNRRHFPLKTAMRFFQKYFVVHKQAVVENSFSTYVCYAPDGLFWLNLYVRSEVDSSFCEFLNICMFHKDPVFLSKPHSKTNQIIIRFLFSVKLSESRKWVKMIGC